MRKAVVVVADANIFAAAMFLCDRLEKLGPPPNTDIIIASDSLADIEMARAVGVSTLFHPIRADIVGRQFPVSRYLTRATYYRIFLPETLGDEYDRVLHLDADTYVHNAKIFSLFDLDMGRHPLAAVRDILVVHSRTPELVAELKQTTAGGIPGKYMNCGMQLFDVSTFREQRVLDRFLAVVDADPTLTFLDQSALNLTLKGDWLELSPSFNMQGSAWNSFVRDVCEPVIVHFLGPVKPWHGPRFTEDHPFRAELERYIATSPWKGYLSRFWSFKDAWKARSEPPIGRNLFTNNPIEIERIVSYLRNTTFADVEQSLMTLNLDLLAKA